MRSCTPFSNFWIRDCHMVASNLISVLIFTGSNDSKIIGGQDVNPPNKYSSVVSLQFPGAHTCAGTIYDNRWVITALHCVLYSGDTALSILRVVAGVHNLNETKTGADVQSVSVVETIRHPGFKY